MSHATLMETRGDILRHTLEESGVSKLELARRLAEATGKTVASKRRQVTAWTRPGGSFTDQTADLLTQALELPDNRLKAAARRARRARLEEKVDAIRAVVVDLAKREGIEIPAVLQDDV
jgi:hypothetical protein